MGAAPAVMGLRLAVLFSIVISTAFVRAQDTCDTVTVTGGDYPGTYALGSGSTYALADSSHVLQAVPFGDARLRRGLAGRPRSHAVHRRARLLADDCDTQMWILTDTSNVTDGFPYYAAFDCATSPAEVDSTWIYVDCADCAEVASIVISCTSELDDESSTDSVDTSSNSVFTVPVIISIAAAALLLVLVLCVVCLAKRRKKKSLTGSNTFADDSEHQSVKMAHGRGAGVAAAEAGEDEGGGSGEGESAGATSASAAAVTVDSVNDSKIGRGGSFRGEGGLVTPVRALGPPLASKSFKRGHEIVDNPVYANMFSNAGGGGGGGVGLGSGAGSGAGSRVESRSASSRQPSRAESADVDKRSVDTRKDSLAEAAAAAHASRAKAMGIELVPPHTQPQGLAPVLRTGAIERRQQGEGAGVKWSAGQNLVPRGGRGGGYDDTSSQYSDSAAGSVFSVTGPGDDVVQQHHYACDDSVAASSPGAYSMYSHFTAGGRTYAGGEASEAWPSDGEEEAEHEAMRRPRRPVHDTSQEMRFPLPPPYDVATDGDYIPSRQEEAHPPERTLSPAGLMARADRYNHQTGRRRGGEKDPREQVREGSRR